QSQNCLLERVGVQNANQDHFLCHRDKTFTLCRFHAPSQLSTEDAAIFPALLCNQLLPLPKHFIFSAELECITVSGELELDELGVRLRDASCGTGKIGRAHV